MQAPRFWPIAALLVLALGGVFGLRSCGEPAEAPPPPLTAEAVATYLRTAPTVRHERHAARAEGARPATWHERPAFAAALAEAGWTLDDYLRVEGQVSAARLAIEDPQLFAEEFGPRDAPPAAVALVRERLDEIRRVQATPAD